MESRFGRLRWKKLIQQIASRFALKICEHCLNLFQYMIVLYLICSHFASQSTKKGGPTKNQVWHPRFKPTISLEILFLHNNRPDCRPHFLGHLILCMDWFPNGTYSTFLKESTWCSAFSPMSKRNAEGDVVNEVWGVGETKRCWWNFPLTRCHVWRSGRIACGQGEKRKKGEGQKGQKSQVKGLNF